MNYQEKNVTSTNKTLTARHETSSGPSVMGASTLTGDNVYNPIGNSLGDIKEIMLDLHSGRISYAVLSHGGFLGVGEKLFAVPWNALTLDTAKKRFTLNVDSEKLKKAPSFDKNNWPDMADSTWAKNIHDYYGTSTSSFGSDRDLGSQP